jgi:Subtilase family
MKRLIIYPMLMAIAVFLASTGALMQEASRPQLGGRDGFTANIETPNALPQSHLNQNSIHKVIINEEDPAHQAVYNELVRLNAIVKEIPYGGFKLVMVNHEAVGGLEALRGMQVSGRDDLNYIGFNGALLDTSNLQTTSQAIPTDLRQQRMADALKSGIAPTSGNFVVQFEGPIKEEWRAAIEQTGARIITYIPNNAYIVRADSKAAFGVWRLKTDHPFVQYVGDYHPVYRLSPEMRAARQLGGSEYVKVTVQFIAGPDSAMKIEELKRTAVQFMGETRVLNYHNVSVMIPASQLTELAGDDNVFSISKYGSPIRMDEAQGQIVAGNLRGSSPSGPGYLAWLASKGFNSSQFRSFAVNVVDDAYSLTGHPDLPSSRIAFQNNPTGQTGPLPGHGFLNAHIIGGFNSGTGSAFEDARGFNYGLGIAPWARVGVTAIFGPGTLDPIAFESAAYGRGARISSNSVGLRDAAGNPIPIYTAVSQLYDALVRDAQSGVAGLQQLSIVFAAGNFGGANTITTPNNAKNVITVGASENVRMTGGDGCGVPNTGADNANDMTSFSSRGPVNAAGGDGRFKPDIVAPGTHIQAGGPQSNYDGSGVCPGNQFFPPGQTLYTWSSGTSQATPAVSGGAALVYQDFLNKGMGAPSPAMIKAVLMNSATYMTGTGAGGNLPSNSQGMGRLNLGRAFDGVSRILVNQTQLLNTTGQVYQVSGCISSGSKPFRVTLAWTDAPGPTTGAPWVNNLDLEVTINGVTYKGNHFSGDHSVSGGTADVRNNVESVFLPAGTTGNFTVTVRAINIAGDGVPGNSDATDQDFALVIFNGRRR